MDEHDRITLRVTALTKAIECARLEGAVIPLEQILTVAANVANYLEHGVVTDKLKEFDPLG